MRRIRAYTIHWRRFAAAAPAAAWWLYRTHRDGGPTWFVANLLMLLVLFLSIRREQRGLEDGWRHDQG